MKKNRLYELAPLAMDFCLTSISIGKQLGTFLKKRQNRVQCSLLLPFLLEVAFHTLFHVGSKGIYLYLFNRKYRVTVIKIVNSGLLMAKPYIQQKLLTAINSHPGFQSVSTKTENLIKKFSNSKKSQ